jgi:membrane protease YdiL (CAAX protease family)
MVVVAWLVWIIFVFFASQLAVIEVVAFLPVSLEDTLTMTIVEAAVYLLMLVLAVGGPWLIRKSIKLPKLRELFAITRRIKGSDVLRGVGGTLVYYLIMLAVMLPLTLLLPDIMGQDQPLGFTPTGNSWWQLCLIFTALVVVAPVAEELVMRGLLFGRIRARLPFWPTAIIISAVFAAAHLQVNVAIDTFILSMVMCYVREKTGVIYPTILMHVVKNSLAFTLLFLTF